MAWAPRRTNSAQAVPVVIVIPDSDSDTSVYEHSKQRHPTRGNTKVYSVSQSKASSNSSKQQSEARKQLRITAVEAPSPSSSLALRAGQLTGPLKDLSQHRLSFRFEKSDGGKGKIVFPQSKSDGSMDNEGWRDSWQLARQPRLASREKMSWTRRIARLESWIVRSSPLISTRMITASWMQLRRPYYRVLPGLERKRACL